MDGNDGCRAFNGEQADTGARGAQLLLRIMEDEGRLRRSITVVKKRHGPHDLDVHELFIRSEGVSVVPYNPLPDA